MRSLPFSGIVYSAAVLFATARLSSAVELGAGPLGTYRAEQPAPKAQLPKQEPEIRNPPSVSTGKRYAYIEGELDQKTELVLRIGAEKDKMIWILRGKEDGVFVGGVYPSDKIKQIDGTLGAGIVFGIDSRNSTGYVVPPSVSIPLPSGELIFREDKKIAWRDGVGTFADLKQADGKLVPVSIFIRERN